MLPLAATALHRYSMLQMGDRSRSYKMRLWTKTEISTSVVSASVRTADILRPAQKTSKSGFVECNIPRTYAANGVLRSGILVPAPSGTRSPGTSRTSTR